MLWYLQLGSGLTVQEHAQYTQYLCADELHLGQADLRLVCVYVSLLAVSYRFS